MLTLDFVKESELCKGLSQEVLQEIIPLCQEVDYPRGAVIFEENTPAQKIYILEYGLVTLRIDTPAGKEKVMVTAIRDAGEIFGWSALIAPYVYTSTAVCLEDTKAIVVDSSKLLPLLEQNPAAGYIVMKNVCAVVVSRLRKARTALISALSPGLISHG